MTESDFWTSLEYRICSEMSGMRERSLKNHWCDGLVATQLHLQGRPRITGMAWFGETGQEEWGFTLYLRRRYRSRGEIVWATLLPGEYLTGWLEIDLKEKHLRMDPRAAVSDDSKGGRPRR